MDQQRTSGILHRPGESQAIRPEVSSRTADDAIAAARQCLLDLQKDDGHWCAELEGDTILESEYVMVLLFLGFGDDPKIIKAANYLRQRQLAEGGWALFPGGPADVSSSVKAYFVLKLAGDDAKSEHMIRACHAIRRLGGLDACNSFTKIYLSIFGQYEWSRSPGVPPELILFPKWSPFNIYEISSWSRAIVVPLSIIWAHKPRCEVPDHASLEELRIVDSRVAGPRFSRSSLAHHGWSIFFQLVDRCHKLFERVGFLPLRPRAIEQAEQWVLQRLEKSDGLGAIFPPIVNTLIAFRCLGYDLDHPVIQGQIHELEKLEIETDDTLRVQPCKSPVWDTALAINALAERQEGEAGELDKAIEWLLEHEVRQAGDWTEKNPQCPVGGWYFEYANEFYPDADDTAQILSAVSKVEIADPDLQTRWQAAQQRATGWLLSMQNRDGGWASFDKGCDREFLTYIPFADHNAMIDPSTTDLTSRAIEALSGLGYDKSSPAVRKGIDFILRDQEPDGSWYGRWGCNYLYGTWLALWALDAAGEDPQQEPIQRAAEWVRSCQNSDGGWGELPASYADPAKKGIGPSTAAQTAWALMSLMAAGDTDSASVESGLEFLITTQEASGGWTDEAWTGTGFPEVFYLKYHLYATYFPLLALEIWHQRWGQISAGAAGPHPVERVDQ